MAVTIRVGGSTATCNNYQWTSQDKLLQRKLRDLLDPHGATGADPWPDYTAAMAAVDALGGKIVGTSNRPRSVPGRIY